MEELVEKQFVTLYLPEKLAKELNAYKDDFAIQETIIKGYIKREVDWLEQELKEIDDATIKYKAKLIGIKDAYGKAQDEYVEELEKLSILTQQKEKEINDRIEKIRDSVSGIKHQITGITKELESIPLWKLDDAINTLEKYEKLTDRQKNLIKNLLITNRMITLFLIYVAFYERMLLLNLI